MLRDKFVGWHGLDWIGVLLVGVWKSVREVVQARRSDCHQGKKTPRG